MCKVNISSLSVLFSLFFSSKQCLPADVARQSGAEQWRSFDGALTGACTPCTTCTPCTCQAGCWYDGSHVGINGRRTYAFLTAFARTHTHTLTEIWYFPTKLLRFLSATGDVNSYFCSCLIYSHIELLFNLPTLICLRKNNKYN